MMNWEGKTSKVSFGKDQCKAEQYTAKDFANSPIMISKNSQMIDVIEKLTELGISRLVVHDMGKPIGIITTKDWVMLLLSNKNGEDPYKVPLTKAMHRIAQVKPDTPIRECVKTILLKGISSLVVMENDKMVGIFTKTDLIRHYSQNYSHDSFVSEYMRKKFASVRADEPVSKALEMMKKYRTPRLIVTDDAGKYCGIITMGDFFRSAFSINRVSSVEERLSILEKIRNQVTNESTTKNTYIRDIMSETLISVKQSDSLDYACKIMLEKNIDSVVVMDSSSKPCGLLSKTDVMSALYGRMQIMKRITACEITPKRNMKILIA
ncbi:MAG: CBS domain-containing protein, partial [Nitrosopumilaceae archaeon]|nr:CBS domain-containing protein [Nitrosopumilaceae archaeon]